MIKIKKLASVAAFTSFACSPMQASQQVCAVGNSCSQSISGDLSINNLNSYWFVGSTDLAAGFLSSCGQHFSFPMKIEQSNSVLGASVTQVAQDLGSGVLDKPERLTGRVQGLEISLSGDEIQSNGTTSSVEYRLRFDEKTMHLYGTRNGVNVWIVPIDYNTPCSGNTVPGSPIP